MRKLVGIVLFTGCIAATQAETTDPGTDAGARSPGDLTPEERVEMMTQAHGYSTCVYEEAITNIDVDPDIRRIADLAMGQCDNRLAELGATISNWGFPDYFAEGFTRRVRSQAARKLLPELAMRKGR